MINLTLWSYDSAEEHSSSLKPECQVVVLPEGGVS